MNAIAINKSNPPGRCRLRVDATDVLRACLQLKPGEWIGLTNKDAAYARNGFGMWKVGKYADHFAKLVKYAAGDGVTVILYGPMPEVEYVSPSILVHCADELRPAPVKQCRHAKLYDWMVQAKPGECITYTSDDSSRGVSSLLHRRKMQVGGEFKTKTMDHTTLWVKCIQGVEAHA